MTYSSLEQLSTAISGIYKEFDDMRLEMKSMVKALDGQWEGTAYEEFISTYDKMDDKLYLICTSVQNYVTAIQAAAENEKETENSSVGSIRNKQRNYSFAPPAKGRG